MGGEDSARTEGVWTGNAVACPPVSDGPRAHPDFAVPAFAPTTAQKIARNPDRPATTLAPLDTPGPNTSLAASTTAIPAHTTANTTITNLITGDGTATYTLIAANGDALELALDFVTTFDAGGVTFEGTNVVTGGTGRFATATGSGSASGSATFTSPDSGVGSFSITGTLSRHG